MSNDEVAAPTVMLESIFITVAIEAKEGRDRAIIDLQVSFLYAWNKDDVVMNMKGELAEHMVIAP